MKEDNMGQRAKICKYDEYQVRNFAFVESIRSQNSGFWCFGARNPQI